MLAFPTGYISISGQRVQRRSWILEMVGPGPPPLRHAFVVAGTVTIGSRGVEAKPLSRNPVG